MPGRGPPRSALRPRCSLDLFADLFRRALGTALRVSEPVAEHAAIVLGELTRMPGANEAGQIADSAIRRIGGQELPVHNGQAMGIDALSRRESEMIPRGIPQGTLAG